MSRSVDALAVDGPVAPDWRIFLLSGVGSLFAGNLGASLHDRALRLLLGVLATALAVLYASPATRNPLTIM